MSTILTISDLHIPFEHPDALEFCLGLKKAYRPDLIINLGDELDQYCFSQYDKDPAAKGADDEIELALERIAIWHEAFPNMLLCLGNHTMRYMRKAVRGGLSPRLIRKIEDWTGAPKGWQWAEKWEAEGILFFHGEPYRGVNAPKHMLQDRKQNQVHGHLHSLAGVTYSRSAQEKEAHWILSTGCLIDEESYAFKYEKENRVKPIIGTGIIVDGTPIFEELR